MVAIDDASKAEFGSTTTRAVSACAGLTIAEQGSCLAGDGLLGVIAAEDVGGLGLPLAFAVPVIAAASAAGLEFPLLESVLLGRALQRRLPRAARAIVAGSERATVAWAGSVAATSQADRVVLNGCVARAPRAVDVGLLLVRVGNGDAALVPIADAVIEGPDGIDLAQPEYTVRLDNVSIPADHLLAEGSWQDVQSDAYVLRAAAILGAAEHCLALAKEHVSNRRQFGHALSYNQSIRHTLARHKLGLESIRHSIARALFEDAGLRERRVAFLAASANGTVITEGAIQMHGGMGFTWDIPIHRYVRRVRAMQAQGDASGVLATLGLDYIEGITSAS